MPNLLVNQTELVFWGLLTRSYFKRLRKKKLLSNIDEYLYKETFIPFEKKWFKEGLIEFLENEFEVLYLFIENSDEKKLKPQQNVLLRVLEEDGCSCSILEHP